MTEQLNSSNTWDWNCGSKNDLDYRIIWGSNGSLTIQRNYLRKIIYALDCWNEINGRVQKSSTIDYPRLHPFRKHFQVYLSIMPLQEELQICIGLSTIQ